MNFNEFNILRVKGIEVIANFIADHQGEQVTNPGGTVTGYDDSAIKRQLSELKAQVDEINLGATNEKVKSLEASIYGLSELMRTNGVLDEDQQASINQLLASIVDMSRYATIEYVNSLPIVGQGDIDSIKSRIDIVESGISSLRTVSGQLESGIYDNRDSINAIKAKLEENRLAIAANTQSASSNAAEITQVKQKVSENTATGTSNTARLTTIESKLRGNSKTVNLDNQDFIDVFDGANFIYVPVTAGNSRNLVEIKSGITGQIVNIRLNSGVTLKHDSARIRLKSSVDVVASSANQIVTLVCLSGGGASGSSGVWMEMGRNF